MSFITNNPLHAQKAGMLHQIGTQRSDETASKVILVGGALGNAPPVIYTPARLDLPLNQSPATSLMPEGKAYEIPLAKPALLQTAPASHPPLKDAEHLTPLMRAIKAGDLAIARQLLTAANRDELNASDASKFTPLTRALAEKDHPQVKLLLELGADPNKHDNFGALPLSVATAQGAKPMMQLLVSKGAYVNQIDRNGTSPLSIALCKDDIQLVEFVLNDLKANPNQACNGDGYHPLELATYLDKKHFEALLVKAGASTTTYGELLLRKIVAHVWGQEGKTFLTDHNGVAHAFPLLGFPAAAAVCFLNPSLIPFTEDQRHFTPAERSEIAEMTRNLVTPLDHCPVTNAMVVKRMNAGKPTLIFAGTKAPQAHAISYLVTKDRLYICNRGLGNDKDYAVRCYKLKPHMRCERLIASLRKTYESMKERNEMHQRLPVLLAQDALDLDDLDWENPQDKNVILERLAELYPIKQDLDQFLAHPQLEFLPQESLKLKDQSVGNCVWASSVKGGIAALFQHYKKGPEIYKEFTAISRKAALESYLNSSKDPDLQLLERIGSKLIKKIETKKHYDAATYPHTGMLAKLRRLTGLSSLS